MLDERVRGVRGGTKQAYGVRKVWKRRLQKCWQVAGCAVERLMRGQDLTTVVRDKVVESKPRLHGKSGSCDANQGIRSQFTREALAAD